MKVLLMRSDSRRKFFMFLGDIVLIFLAVFLSIALYSFFVRFFTYKPLLRPLKPYAFYMAVVVHLVILYVFEMYEMRERYEKLHILTSLASVSCISFLVMFALAKLIRINQTTMVYIFAFFFITTYFLYYWRRIFIKVFLSSRYFIKHVLFVGRDFLTDEIRKLMEHSDYKVVGFINSGSSGKVEDAGKLKVIDPDSDLDDFIKTQKIRTLIVTTDKKHSLKTLKKVYAYKFRGLEVYSSDYFYEIFTRKFPITHFLKKDEIPYVNLDPFVNMFFKNTKRILDFSGALFLLIVFSPVFLVIWIIIRAMSGNPVFYLQERLGFQEKPFKLIKFRTMIKGAEDDKGPQWADKEDIRVTRVGKILRKTHLDELPQLINVLIGDLSFVGPRPIRKHFADLIEQQAPFYSLRFMIKPGVTGWAQVHYDYGGTVEGHIDKFQYDLYYIKRASLFLDLFIILKTLQTVVRRPAY